TSLHFLVFHAVCFSCTSLLPHFSFLFFFFTDPAPSEIYTLSLHDALPIYQLARVRSGCALFLIRHTVQRPLLGVVIEITTPRSRSEEHTSELQSRENLVCRLLLEKKKKKKKKKKKSYINRKKYNIDDKLDD